MKNKEFEIILEMLNQNLSVLSRNGYKTFDEDNEGYFLQRFYYDEADDCIKFSTEEQ